MGRFYESISFLFIIMIDVLLLLQYLYNINKLIIPVATFSLIFYIIMHCRVYLFNDTEIDTPYFSIDRARTIRFGLFVYVFGFILLTMILIFLPVIIAVLVGIIIGIGLLLANIAFLILNIILLLLSGSSTGFLNIYIAFDIASIILNFLFQFDNSIFELYYLGSIILGIFLLNRWLGKYVEDLHTNNSIIKIKYSILSLLVAIFFILFIGDGFYENTGFEILSIENLLILVILLSVFSKLISSYYFGKKQQLNDYNLSIFPNYGRYILVLFGLGLTGFLTLLFLVFIAFQPSSLMNNLNLLNLIAAVIGALLILFMTFYLEISGLSGDFPMDVKLDEVEFREKLQTGELIYSEFF